MVGRSRRVRHDEAVDSRWRILGTCDVTSHSIRSLKVSFSQFIFNVCGLSFQMTYAGITKHTSLFAKLTARVTFATCIHMECRNTVL